MSCHNCACEDCMAMQEAERLETKESNLPELPPPPPFTLTSEDYESALQKAFERFKDVKIIPMVPLTVAAMQEVVKHPAHWKRATDECHDYVLAQGKAGKLVVTKGKSGGVQNPIHQQA